MSVIDKQVREWAATENKKNVVVTAGAGTGKTTLLIDRLIHLLFRQPGNLQINEIVALTFTNKAAQEIRHRLRNRLLAFRDMSSHSPRRQEEYATSSEQEQFEELLQRYQLTAEHIQERSMQALKAFERSHIGTIHSFAGHLLRLFPMQARVDPSFKEDDGNFFLTHFDKEWTTWLEGELGPQGHHHPMWRQLLHKVKLEDLKQLTLALCDEVIPIEGIIQDAGARIASEPIQRWLQHLDAKGQVLLTEYGTSHILENMLREAMVVLNALMAVHEKNVQQTINNGGMKQETQDVLDRRIPVHSGRWKKEDYEEARHIIKVAQALLQVEVNGVSPFLTVVTPFVRQCRRKFLNMGYVSFSGLLVKARDLVRDHLHIRQDLKQQIRSILVDEFQDTDPIQYELLLYLSEERGREARSWNTLSVEPGKLFIVGDPKQSIYAFRRADMEAFDYVVKQIVLGSGEYGEEQCLQTNFRSHGKLLAPINACFSRLFPKESKQGIQPKYENLQAANGGSPTVRGEGVAVRLVSLKEKEGDADAATRAEAEGLAKWMKEDLLGTDTIRLHDKTVTVQSHHVALIFRTLTQASIYLEALRRYDIPYRTEGEKHFYQRQEIIDCVNVLRVVVNPHDHIAMVGVLRSSIGGVSDRDIERIVREEKLDFQRVSIGSEGELSHVYRSLRVLHQTLPLLPLEEVMDAIWGQLPMIELASASRDGEQAMGNLQKFREIVQELSLDPDMTLGRLVTILSTRIAQPASESEMALSEEGEEDNQDGAIQILSIHKAKGLEFPVVIFAGLHRGTEQRESSVSVDHDWTTGIIGIRVRALRTIGGVYVHTKLKEREKAEHIRLLYVAMTRAKRRLVLSAGVVQGKSLPPNCLLGLVMKGLELDSSTLESVSSEVMEANLATKNEEVTFHMVASPKQSKEFIRKEETREKTSFQNHEGEDPWLQWIEKTEKMSRRPLKQTPTSQKGKRGYPLTFTTKALDEGSGDVEVPCHEAQDPSHESVGKIIGELAHRILEEWDYTASPQELQAHATRLVSQKLHHQHRREAQAIQRDLAYIFQVFGESSVYAKLQQVKILGREIPFIVPWEQMGGAICHATSPGGILEGVIDLVYRWHGDIWVADYKTDRVNPHSILEWAQRYNAQLNKYTQAVAQGLGVKSVRGEVIFLRTGQSVEIVPGDENQSE
jgi:ATP-dependent helicase/nuclease subunit A